MRLKPMKQNGGELGELWSCMLGAYQATHGWVTTPGHICECTMLPSGPGAFTVGL